MICRTYNQKANFDPLLPPGYLQRGVSFPESHFAKPVETMAENLGVVVFCPVVGPDSDLYILLSYEGERCLVKDSQFHAWLQERWEAVHIPARLWDRDDLAWVRPSTKVILEKIAQRYREIGSGGYDWKREIINHLGCSDRDAQVYFRAMKKMLKKFVDNPKLCG